MKNKLLATGLVGSLIIGAAGGVWFTFNPLSDQAMKLIENAVWGGVIGVLWFFVIVLSVAMVADVILGVDVI